MYLPSGSGLWIRGHLRNIWAIAPEELEYNRPELHVLLSSPVEQKGLPGESDYKRPQRPSSQSLLEQDLEALGKAL